jgi:hypothetical protein
VEHVYGEEAYTVEEVPVITVTTIGQYGGVGGVGGIGGGVREENEPLLLPTGDSYQAIV